MWYDKQLQQFHNEDRDVVDVVAKLRLMATRIEQGTHGCLCLNNLGDIFGNEFWNLIYFDFLDALSRRGR
jgi:hypothetical protein